MAFHVSPLFKIPSRMAVLPFPRSNNNTSSDPSWSSASSLFLASVRFGAEGAAASVVVDGRAPMISCARPLQRSVSAILVSASSSCPSGSGLSIASGGGRGFFSSAFSSPAQNASFAARVRDFTSKSARRLTIRRAASRQQYDVPQKPETVPLWLWICLESHRIVKYALQFLWEQPRQLKDIEWPSFQSTIRMAALTVVVVALLIIFLATIDSTFSYVLASILRRVP